MFLICVFVSIRFEFSIGVKLLILFNKFLSLVLVSCLDFSIFFCLLHVCVIHLWWFGMNERIIDLLLYCGSIMSDCVQSFYWQLTR